MRSTGGITRICCSANSELWVGARALAKHYHRDQSTSWWGNCTGSKCLVHWLPCCKWIGSYLPLSTLTYLHSVSHASLFFRFLHAQNPAIQTQDSRLWRFSLCFGPYVGNSLPQDIRQCSTLPSFKTKLKTFLFSQYFGSS